MKNTYVALALFASLTLNPAASAQTTSFESIVWGATLDVDSQITYICDLQPNANWSGTITSQGSPAGSENAFTNTGQLEYTIDPTKTHTFAASFAASGTPDETKNLIISHSSMSMRFTIQVIASESFTFESAAGCRGGVVPDSSTILIFTHLQRHARAEDATYTAPRKGVRSGED